MKITLRIEKISDDIDCYEDTVKVIKYRISNNNRTVVKTCEITARTFKEDGSPTKTNCCKEIIGIRTQLLTNDDCTISCHIRLNKEFTEVIEIKGKNELSAIDLDIKVSGTLYISKVSVP